MANRITGSTDTTGAISIRPKSEKSLLLVCKSAGTAVANTIYTVNGTADATTKFGEEVAKLIKVLINNGVDNIKCVSVGTTGDAEAYADAMDASLVDNTIKVVIIDTTVSEIITALKAHLNKAEGEDMFRYGVVGLAATAIEDAIEEVEAINDKRIFAPFPHFVDHENKVLSGTYAAAGLAALIMTETSDPAMPMNGVEFIGFGGTSLSLLKADKNNLEKGGITAVVGNSSPSVWRLVTTRTKDGDVEDPIWHEGTTLFIADDVLDTMIGTLQATYKRTKNTARIIDAIRTTVIGILEVKEGLEIIENFDKNTVSVIQDPEDIYGVLVDYEFDVVTPLYTITISQHMKL